MENKRFKIPVKNTTVGDKVETMWETKQQERCQGSDGKHSAVGVTSSDTEMKKRSETQLQTSWETSLKTQPADKIPRSSWEFSLKTWGHDVFKKLYFLKDSLAGKKSSFIF